MSVNQTNGRRTRLNRMFGSTKSRPTTRAGSALVASFYPDDSQRVNHSLWPRGRCDLVCLTRQNLLCNTDYAEPRSWPTTGRRGPPPRLIQRAAKAGTRPDPDHTAGRPNAERRPTELPHRPRVPFSMTPGRQAFIGSSAADIRRKRKGLAAFPRQCAKLRQCRRQTTNSSSRPKPLATKPFVRRARSCTLRN